MFFRFFCLSLHCKTTCMLSSCLSFIFLALMRFVVIPVQFDDVKLQSGEEQLTSLCVRAQKYFEHQFSPDGSFHFDLTRTVTLSKGIAYYGSNYSERKDVLLSEALKEACEQLNPEIDFSLYDNDGDGAVDNVCLIVAGTNEASGGSPDHIWPAHRHLGQERASLMVDGKHIDSYTVCTEMDGKGNWSGVGLFCHELAHSFGLVDMYDTDLSLSGGESEGLRRTSLMDMGCYNGGGETPPNFNAIDHELLSLGSCRTLEKGDYLLQSIDRGHEYFRIDGDVEGEYFLLECRSSRDWDSPLGIDGLVIYHIDKSSNNALWSDYYNSNLSASQRWEYMQINNNPAHPCAYISSVLSGQTDRKEAFLNFWDSSSGSLAICFNGMDSQGRVSFSVLEPIRITSQSIFQTSVILRWSVDPEIDGISGIEIGWEDSDGVSSVRSLGPDCRSFTIENLRPRSRYKISLKLICESGQYTLNSSFVTKYYHEGTYPYIYLSGSLRHDDGAFFVGSKIELSIYNAPDALGTEWFFEGKSIKADADGFFTLERSGELKAVIHYDDMSTEVITKRITVK